LFVVSATGHDGTGESITYILGQTDFERWADTEDDLRKIPGVETISSVLNIPKDTMLKWNK